MTEWKTNRGTKIKQVLSGRSNSFLITTPGNNILVDTGKSTSIRKLLFNIALNTPANAQLDFLVITHTHFDHCQNAALIKEKFKCKVILSENDYEFAVCGASPLPIGTNMVTRIISGLGTRFFRKRCSFSPFTPDIAFRDHFEISDQDSKIILIKTEGHSRGSISVIIDNEIAIVGDALFGVFKGSVLPPFFDDQEKLIDSWGTLLNTGCDLFLPGHGNEIQSLRLAIEYDKFLISKNNLKMETFLSAQKEELEITVNGPKDRNATGREDRIPFKSLLPFSLITFGISWVVIALYVFLPEPMVHLFGQLTGNHPLFYLAVWSPAIAAFFIIFRKYGIKGIKAFLKGLSLWRAPWGWYFFLLLGIPLIFISGAYLNGKLFTEPLPFQNFGPAMIAVALAVIKGPVEEFGWRGFALPLLQRRVAPIWAALIIGTIWGLWHTPAFLLSGTQQSQWDFAPFFLGCIAISVIISALFNATKGSILLCALLHFNLMNPLWPDAQPYDTYLLLVVALIVIWFYRESMFHRKEGIKRVIPAI